MRLRWLAPGLALVAFGLTLMIGTWVMSPVLTQHVPEYFNGERIVPAMDAMLISGQTWIIGLGALIAGIVGSIIGVFAGRNKDRVDLP